MEHFKGIIIAGGRGTRLRPVTKIINKNLLPIYDKPAIYYAINLFKNAGVTKIAIVAEKHYHNDFKKILNSGKKLGVKLTYIADSYNKKGPASAVMSAAKFAKGGNCLVVFADGIYDADIKEEVSTFIGGATIFVKRVEDPKRFGVVEIGNKGIVKSIEEKPQNPKSDYAFTGLAIYDEKLFDYLSTIKPGLNGEYYMNEVDKIYLSKGTLKAKLLEGFWKDMGTFDGMAECVNYFHLKKQRY